jgi:dipeptide/tripeptide permease
VAIHGIVQGLCKPHLLPELSVQRTRPFSIHMYSLPWVSEWCDSCFQTLPQNYSWNLILSIEKLGISLGILTVWTSSQHEFQFSSQKLLPEKSNVEF